MSRQFIRHAQLSPPALQLPAGSAEDEARDDAPTPTMPGLESRLASLSLRHPGQEGDRSAVTNASNCLPQSLQEYSKMGMDQS
jgi:hypothetical protein